MDNLEIRTGRAETFGWLRRPELDTSWLDIWEKPDGTLYGMTPGEVPVLTKYVAFPRLLSGGKEHK